MKAISICKNGSEQCYTFINYNQTGDRMVSHGGAPDNSITIWDWKKATILLKCKNGHDGLAAIVAFSAYNSNQLVSAGIGHIKFWSICQTVTGLKLKCDRGRFEKRDVSDILAIYSMPDGRVLSGCVWGNLLIWQGAQIEYEVRMNNKKSCHNAAIAQILYENNCMWTIGRDGWIKIWSWDSIELADRYEENNMMFAEVNPLYEYNVELSCDLLWLVKLDSGSQCWYGQDGNNGIWSFRIDPELKKSSSTLLYQCHGGKIVGLRASPVSNHLATLGINGTFHVYNYKINSLVIRHIFSADGGDFIWFSQNVHKTSHNRFCLLCYYLLIIIYTIAYHSRLSALEIY